MVCIAYSVTGYLAPGLIYGGSLSEFRAICRSTGGIAAVVNISAAASSCESADRWTILFVLLAVAGVILLVSPVLFRRKG